MRKTVTIIVTVAFGLTLLSPLAAAHRQPTFGPVSLKADTQTYKTPPAGEDTGWVDVESSGNGGGMVAFFDDFGSLWNLLLLRLVGPPTVVTDQSKVSAEGNGIDERTTADFGRRAAPAR